MRWKISFYDSQDNNPMKPSAMVIDAPTAADALTVFNVRMAARKLKACDVAIDIRMASDPT